MKQCDSTCSELPSNAPRTNRPEVTSKFEHCQVCCFSGCSSCCALLSADLLWFFMLSSFCALLQAPATLDGSRHVVQVSMELSGAVVVCLVCCGCVRMFVVEAEVGRIHLACELASSMQRKAHLDVHVTSSAMWLLWEMRGRCAPRVQGGAWLIADGGYKQCPVGCGLGILPPQPRPCTPQPHGNQTCKTLYPALVRKTGSRRC